MSVLNDPGMEQLLADLHARSDAQLADIERYVRDARRSRSLTKEEDFKVYRSDKLLALDQDKGEFCYQICRAIGARRIVEIGTSYGVSTMYLAVAARDNTAGDMVIGTEIEPAKIVAAQALFRRAELDQFIDLREGDFRETLKDIDDPIDFMLIDAWIDAAQPALELMDPWLRQGAIVVCDDVLASTRHDGYRELLAIKGFRTMTLPFRDGLEFSVRC
jgi:predicted O-methyltransferase YrrM